MSRAKGTNLRKRGENPRALGINPRALGIDIVTLRDSGLLEALKLKQIKTEIVLSNQS